MKKIEGFEQQFNENRLIPSSKRWGEDGESLYPFNGNEVNYSPDIEHYLTCKMCMEEEENGENDYIESHLFKRVGITNNGFQVWCERHGNIFNLPLPEPIVNHYKEQFGVCGCCSNEICESENN